MPDETAPPVFSRFQRRVLWHLSQGHTVKGTAVLLATSRTSVVDSLLAIRRKSGCATTTQAVLRAYVWGAIGPLENCGSRASYLRHLDAGEDACPACRAANARWLKQQSEDRPTPQPLGEVHLRIIRSYHCGRSQADLMQMWGVTRSQLHRAVAELYRRLGVAEVPRELRREAALEAAQEQGYLRAEGPVPVAVARGARDTLSQREKEILAAVDGGVPLSVAAPRLGLTAPSLSSRLTEIYRKLDVAHLPRRTKRAAALREARRRGYPV